ncbi:MAG: GMC family oxidoreductase N-terminal domain-containing protein [Myxococcota bacterium]
MNLGERWLAAHGADDPGAASVDAAARAARYPAPVGGAWGPVAAALDWLGPALVLGRPARATDLDDAEFDRVDAGLQAHTNRFVRLSWLLVRAPLLEARYPDPAPIDPGHPLDAFAGELASRRSHSNRSFDVIVIGSGAGGAPVAAALARAGRRVAVIEAGDLVRAEAANRAVERHYVDQGMLGSAAGDGAALVIAGRAVGGTTAINSGTSFRPLPAQLEAWDRDAGTSFAGGALEPYLARVEERLGIAATPEALLDASSRLVREGLERLGRGGAFPLPRNAPGCRGSGRCCFGCPSGAKRSTDRAYLPELVASGGTLLARTTAVGIDARSDGVSVWVRDATGTRRLTARHLVLAGGALWTPALIRAHRLGQRWKVAGDGLKIHPASKVFGWMPGALAHGGVPQALGYHAPELPRVTFEGAHTPSVVTATLLQAAGRRHREWMAAHDHLANYGMMVRDRGAGSVRAVAGRPVLRYALHPEDVRDLGHALLIAAEALFAAGAERVMLPVAGPDAELSSARALAEWTPDRFSRATLMTSGFHPQGTAGIGRVVDPDLRLVGAPAVSVCDASVMPDSPGVNPQVTILALSERLADRLSEEG